jgi:hypothetical protein
MKSKSLVPTRENQVAVRYSDAELELVLEGAVLGGVNRSEFIREASKKEARRLTKARWKTETSSDPNDPISDPNAQQPIGSTTQSKSSSKPYQIRVSGEKACDPNDPIDSVVAIDPINSKPMNQLDRCGGEP